MTKIWNEKEYSVVRLGEIARVKSGFAFSSKDYVQDSNVSLITIKNIDFSGVVFGNTTFYLIIIGSNMQTFKLKMEIF